MINKELLKKCLDEGLVFMQKHPEADLYIYNYADKCQYEKSWNEITLQARGLILDSEMNYVTRPFGKFFNIQEHGPEEIPNEEFEIFDKLDGSFGQIYWLNNKPYISSRGSFNSDQSIRANKILYEKYQHTFDKLDKTKTYIFEIIYPENRIVVNYNDMEDIILTAITDNKTGKDLPLEYDLGFKVVKKYDGINDLEELKALEENNKEGFVIKFKSGFRVKMKFAEYVRLHRVITGVSNIVIWEYLSQNKSFDELLSRVPDEFYDWVKETEIDLKTQYSRRESLVKYRYDQIMKKIPLLAPFNERRKLFAGIVMSNDRHISSILFNIFDNKDYSSIIWKYIKPKYAKPFSLKIEN